MANEPSSNSVDHNTVASSQEDLTAEPIFYVEDETEPAASGLPALVDVDEENEDEYGLRRQPIVLDLGAGGASTDASVSFDLNALIGQFDAVKRAPAKPVKEADEPPRSNAVFDVSGPSASAEMQRLRSELDTERNNLRRAQADLINYRRKAEQDRERAVRDSSERVIKQMLLIVDDFERSLAATAQTRSYDQLSDGVQAILRNFTTLLDKHGIEQVPTVGSMFNPDIHEAVSVDEASEQLDDSIVEELRKGYQVDGRLIRAALVKVAKRSASSEVSASSVADRQASADEQVPA